MNEGLKLPNKPLSEMTLNEQLEELCPEPKIESTCETGKEGNQMDFLNELRTKAEQMGVHDDLTRRPSWAPRILVGEELLVLLYELSWLGENDLAVARLWSRFTDPRRGPVGCEGFELRAGETHNGKKIWTAQYFDKNKVLLNLKKQMDSTNDPRFLSALDDFRRQTEARIGGWSFGPNWSWSRKPGRLEKLKRAVQLGQARVMDFAGAADEQMRAAGRYFGHCCCCGRALTDPQSIELGIGPECRHKFGLSPAQSPGALVIGGQEVTAR